MAQMGYVEGQPLGARGSGLVVPVRPASKRTLREGLGSDLVLPASKRTRKEGLGARPGLVDPVRPIFVSGGTLPGSD